MRLRLKIVHLRDFRSFEESVLAIDDVTVIVGANNVGKTNLLDAISLLSPTALLDTTKDHRRNSSSKGPTLQYTLDVSDLPT